MSIIKNLNKMPHNIDGNYLIPSVFVPTIPSLPTVVTSDPYGIGTDYIYTGGNVTSDGGLQVTEKGVCYSLTSTPTISDASTSNGINAGWYLSDLLSLELNTTYYIRSYAINSLGISYGNEISVTTRNISIFTPPIVETTGNYDITGYGFNVEGDVSSNGGKSLYEKGIYIGTDTDPSTNGIKYISTNVKVLPYNIRVGQFNENILNNTTYYYQAYAINEEGTGLGIVKSLTTTQWVDQTVITRDASGVNGWSFIATNYREDLGYYDYPILGSFLSGSPEDKYSYWYKIGICYSENPGVTIADASTEISEAIISLVPTEYSIDISNLNDDTTYYFKAYTIREIDNHVVYGEEKTVNIPTLILPTVTTNTNTLITNTQILFEGVISNVHEFNVTNSGFVFGTSPNPTGNIRNIGSNSGYIAHLEENLVANTTYYYRSYIEYTHLNTQYTIYGNQITISTAGIDSTWVYSDLDSYDKTDVDYERDIAFLPHDNDVYISTAIRYYPESVIPEDRIITLDVMTDPNTITRTFSTNPNVQNVYYRLMQNAPYRSVLPGAIVAAPGIFFIIPFNVTFPSTGKYVLGIISDNFYTVYINNKLFIKSDDSMDTGLYQTQSFFKMLNFFEIDANEGVNKLSIKTVSPGGDSVFGFIIWDDTFTISQLTGTNPPIESTWANHVLYTSEELIGQIITSKSCPAGYDYDPDFDGDGNGACVKIDYTSPHNADDDPTTKTIIVDTYFNNPNNEIVSSHTINYGNGYSDVFTALNPRVEYTYPAPAIGTKTIIITVVTNVATYNRTYTMEII